VKMTTEEKYQSAVQSHQAGDLRQAEHIYREILNDLPDHADALHMLGVISYQLGDYNSAISCFLKTIQVNPSSAEAYYDLGNAYLEKGLPEETINSYRKAIDLNPDFPEAHCNMGLVLHGKGDIAEAINCYRKAIQLDSEFAYAHWNLSHALLLTGSFKEGWREYEWRRTMEDYDQDVFLKPLWDGRDVPGSTILIHSEQGLGDTLQFIRYVPLVAQRGAKIIVECSKKLKSLLQGVEGISGVVDYDEQAMKFDVHYPLLSLPFLFDTTLETIPSKVPYIWADTPLAQKWKNSVQDDNARIKIGLVWSGYPHYERDLERSCSLETFAPLAQFKDIAFYSLQKGKASEEAKNPPKGMRLIDLTEEIHDFSDTAALMENLDLLISVDTAVAHLAGALGKPVWTLLPFVPDWRWMLHRKDSPWYPTMRLFRQPSPGDWKSVIAEVSGELRQMF
jgi:hypothetical protein